ncbi:conserved hypothetical protein [Vibrio crassostreae]|nr:conserved hypothetical protein [Vibrio crassostreae]CAK2323478.1 conserved hypothetical protein [Vibrio crassostreae]CAK2451016.1 conserved hypothetical protein [Vibrio crassostreae]CAK2771736.1 conserved hypothetical protein [Vibrio crassostreae]
MNILFLDEKKAVSRLVDVSLFERDSSITVEYFGSSLFIFSFGGLSKWDIIIDANYTNSFHKLIVRHCNKIGIPTVLLHDGVFEWKNAFENGLGYNLYSSIEHSIFFYFGGQQFRNYLTALTGKPCVSYVPKFIMKENMHIQNDGDKFDFMLTVANKSYFDRDDFVNLVELFQSLIDFLNHSKYTYCLRVFDQNILKALNVDGVTNIIDCDLEGAIKAVSKGVLTTKSTLQFEIMQYGLPVCELIYRDVPIFSTPGWVLYMGCDYEKTLSSMYSPSQERLFHQKNLLSDFFELDKNEPLKLISDLNSSANYYRAKVVLKKIMYILKIKN